MPLEDVVLERAGELTSGDVERRRLKKPWLEDVDVRGAGAGSGSVCLLPKIGMMSLPWLEMRDSSTRFLFELVWL